jgi:LacI family transcriptional regulator
MRITIKDIAKKTGLSTTAVSLILNEKPNSISSAKKLDVIELARRLNYRPSQLAISFKRQRSHTVGLILPSLTNVFFSELASAVSQELQNEDWNISLFCTNDIFSNDIKYINMLYDSRVEGIIYIMSSSFSSHPKSDLTIFESLGIPIVFADRYDPIINRSSVMHNNMKGSYLAVKHLAELGHKRIAYITGPSSLKVCQDRLEGYKIALTEYNIPFDQGLIFEGNCEYENGYGLTGEIIRSTDTTAIFTFNDITAYGVINRLKNDGLHVPDDISVAGFDNIMFSSMLQTPLTTVNQSAAEIGRIAARRLITEIQEEDMGSQSFHITLEPSLILRSSTAPPKSG